MALPSTAPPAGRLEDAPLANVLAWARDSRATGCVTIRAGGAVNRLYLSEGRPAGTVLAQGYRPLPQLLLELGWLDELALDRALEEVYGGTPLEEALVKTGALPEERLEQALALQEGRNLEALGALTQGEVEFRSEPLPPDARVRLSPERALLDALALPSGQARTADLIARLQGLAARLNSAFEGAEPALHLRDDELRAVEALRAGLEVETFVTGSGLQAERARALLALLIELELVTAVDLQAEAQLRAMKAEMQRRAEAARLAAREAELTGGEAARLASAASETLEQFEQTQIAEALKQAEREAWFAQARAVDAAQAVPDSPAPWLEQHDAFHERLSQLAEAEAQRVAETEARAIAVEAERQAQVAAEAERLRLEAERQEQLEREAAAQRAEEERLAREAEEARQAEIAALEAEARRIAEQKRREEDAARLAELERLNAEARARAEAEEARRAEEERVAQKAEEARRAEEERVAKEAEEARVAEEQRLAREAEEARHADEERVAKEAEEARREEEERLAREAAEQARIEAEAAEARRAEEERIAQEAAEQARLEAEAAARAEAEAEQARRAEAERRAQEAAEQARIEAEAEARAQAERAHNAEIARLEAEARKILAQRARAATEEQQRLEAAALAQAAEKAKVEAAEKARLAAEDAARELPTAEFQPLTAFETERREMLAARRAVDERLARQRAEIQRRTQQSSTLEAPAPLPAVQLSADEAQREIQRRFEEQARQWLKEEQGRREPDTLDETRSPENLAESLHTQLMDGLTSDLETLLTNSLRPARPGSATQPAAARPASLPSAPARSAAPVPPVLSPSAAAGPNRVPPEAAQAASSTPSAGDALEFTFDPLKGSDDLESLWDDAPGDDMSNDEEARARRARLRRLGMQNTGLAPANPRPVTASPEGLRPAAPPPEPQARPASIPPEALRPPAPAPIPPAAARPITGPAPIPASARPVTAPAPVVARPITASAPVASPARPTSAGGAAVLPPPDDAQLGREIQQRHGRLKIEDHFARLGLPRTASGQQVKNAFFELAKRYHPDKLPPALAPLADKARELFAAIRESYDLLQNDKSRADYLAQLNKAIEQKVRPQSGEIQTESRRLRNAGEMALRRKAFAEAEQLFAKAYAGEKNANDLASQAWCIYLDPGRRKEMGTVDKMLKQAFGQNANSDQAHYVAGVIARANGDIDKAERHFRAALQTNPNHSDAALELRVLERRKTKGSEPATKKKGFFGL